MKTFKKCFPVLMLLLCMGSIVLLTPGCNLPVAPDELIVVDSSDLAISSIAGNMISGFIVKKGLPVNFRAAGNDSYTQFKWWGEDDLYPNEYVIYAHRDFTYTYHTYGVRRIRLRGIRDDGTYTEVTAQVTVQDSVIYPIDTNNAVNLKINNGSLVPTGQYDYKMYFGADRNKFFPNLAPNETRYNPGWIVGGLQWKGRKFANPNPVNGYWEANFITYDTLVPVQYCWWYDSTVTSSQWLYANYENSVYRHNGQMWVFFKGGRVYVFDGTTYNIPGNQGDEYLRYSSNGGLRYVYMSIREMTYSNPVTFNQNKFYWQHDLINGGGINNAHRGVEILAGSGYMKVTIDTGLIPPANNGLANVRWGQDGQQAPGMFLTDYAYQHPTYGPVAGLQFYDLGN